MDDVFIAGLYRETMRLLEDARDYHLHWEPLDREGMTLDDGFLVSRECLSMTARLTSVMAWVLMRKAVAAGEIPADSAADAENRLMSDPIHTAPPRLDADGMPRRLWRLLDSSRRLYDRVHRIDHAATLARERYAAGASSR